MRILISNDDGIQAKGLEALVKAFCARKHTVIVSAPARQQSGMAHALNVGRPLELVRGEELAAKYGIEAWAVNGTPTDSVKLYLEALAEEKPDVVVSGINHGANLATDILYSGTVGAAMEGMLHDIASFAVSMDVDSTISYEEAAEEMLLRTSTPGAPWLVVEANSKEFARLKVFRQVVEMAEAGLRMK